MFKICTRKECKHQGRQQALDRFCKRPGVGDGYRSWCKDCYAECKRLVYAAHPEREKSKAKAWRKANPSKMKEIQERSDLKRHYQLSEAEYQKRLRSQGGLCAIHKGPQRGRGKRLHVDHDHKTNQIRGLLCGNCNSALGFIKDNPEVAEAIARYLRDGGVRVHAPQ